MKRHPHHLAQRRFGAAVFLPALLVATFATNSSASDCTKAEDIGSEIWRNYLTAGVAAGCIAAAALSGPLVPATVAGCLASAAAWATIQDDAIDFWNSKVGTSSWATVGPRDLLLNDSESGTIWGTSARLFVTVTPAPSGSKVTITETDGKAEAAASICVVSSDGVASKVKSYTFNNSSSAKSNASESFSYTLTNDSVIAIHIDGKSVTNKLSYKVKVTT
jgi:hypothetical protein